MRRRVGPPVLAISGCSRLIDVGRKMLTLLFGLRVASLERSIAFYRAAGYDLVGNVPRTDFGNLTMLNSPATNS